jgi:putative transposase
MKMTRYSEPQILAILRQAEGGVPVSELCREHGMSNASFYKWRSKFDGMDASMIRHQYLFSARNRHHSTGAPVPVAQEQITAWTGAHKGPSTVLQRLCQHGFGKAPTNLADHI